MSKRPGDPLAAALIAAASLGALATGCGAGAAAIVSSGGSSGGGGNAPTALSGFSVDDPKVPPATIRFVLADQESSPATVELFYQVAGSAPEPLTQVPALPSNPAVLSTSPQGTEHAFAWNFAAEDLLPDDAHFEPSVRVWAIVSGGIQEAVVGSNAMELGLGNDAPSASVETPSGEVDGVVPVRFQVADSSDDAIDVRVEYDVVGDDPDQGWQLARPGGLLASEPTPARAFEGVIAPSGGAQLVFFWDTDFDLAELERDARLRLTPVDPVIEGLTVATGAFRVDNNAEPTVALREGLFLANGDDRRGIVIPFTVADEEGDAVDLVFQWRRPNESFPSLPQDPAAVRVLLADPELRRQHRVCSELPRVVEGNVAPIDATTLELPELASDAAHLLAQGIVGLELDLLRSSKVPAPLSGGWAQNPLTAPVAAIPLAEGPRALVLDARGAGAWRLIELELATGELVREIAAGSGASSALALERDERWALVAADVAGAWSVERIEIDTGSAALLAAYDGSTDDGRIRGIASLGSGACAITVGSSLVRLDGGPQTARQAPVLTDLSTPWGVVVDPLNWGRVYVAEHDYAGAGGPGRVLSVDLAAHTATPVVARSSDPDYPGLPRPRTLALARNGTRLLALCDTEPLFGVFELRAVDLGDASRTETFALGGPSTAEASWIASGPDDLVLVTRTAARELAAGGGVEQRRTIAGWDEPRRRVVLDAPLQPTARPGERWRIAYSLRAVPGLVDGSFLWDSSDVASGGDVLVRITPLDAEVGASSVSSVPKHVLAPVEGSRLDLAVGDGAYSAAVADIDSDGDLDLVSANYWDDTLTVLWQEGAGAFDPVPTVLGGFPTIDGPRFVAVADLDQDGDQDLVSANELSDTLSVFWQDQGTFGAVPTVLGGSPTIDAPYCVAAADLDQDGDQDLVSANIESDTLSVFWQSGSGAFDPVPVVLGYFDGSRSVAAADVDGDGDLDLVSANELGDTLTVFWQTSPGAFDSSPAVVGGPVWIDGPSSVAVGDLDQDGDLDLVSANGGSDTLSVFWQGDVGAFDAVPTLMTVGLNPGAIDGPYSVAIADVDRDGDPDLVSSNVWNDTLTVYWQEGAGTFDPVPAVLAGGFPYIDGPVVVADIDGDGDLDLISASDNTDTLIVYRQSSAGTVDLVPEVLAGLPTIDGPQSVAAADVDRDGDLDLVSANWWSQTLTVFWQEGAGTFDPVPAVAGYWPTTDRPSSTAAADVDGDGDLDLVSANYWANRLAVFWQNDAGTFDPVPTAVGEYPTIYGPRSVAVADIDRDGDLDLVSANELSYSLTVYWQEGAGTFDPVPTVVTGWPIYDPWSVSAADVDLDGDLDLVSASYSSNALAVSWQTGPRTFDPVPTWVGDFSIFDGPRFVSAADVDGDGDQDLVSANYYSDTLKVFWQSGARTFDPVPAVLGGFPMIDGPQSVAVEDFDHDGDLDLISANYDSDTLSVFRQSRPGTFDPVPTVVGGFPTIEGPWFVMPVDVDLDGEFDLVSANFDGKKLTVFWGGR